MATIGNSFPGLIDYYSALDGNGDIVPVVEALNVLNPLHRDAYVEEANAGAKHQSSIRTGLPEPTWGKLYQGIPQSKSLRQSVEDSSGFVESMSKIDARLVDDMPKGKGLRADEGGAHLESIAQDVQTNFFYADTATTPERFKGLSARYNSLSNTQVIDAGGRGSDNTSIWMVTWGRGYTGMFYPQGTRAGISRRDLGRVLTNDDNGLEYSAYAEEFRQYVGVFVRDFRFNVRIANVDVSDLRAGTVDIFALLRKARYRNQARALGKVTENQLKNPYMAGGRKTVIYANREIAQALDAAQTNAEKVQLRPDEVAGQEVMSYHDMPIRETDALINNEAAVL